MKKRLLAFLLAVSIAVSMLVMPASAAGNNTAVQFAITLGAMDSEQSGALNAAVTRGAFARMLTSYSTYRESVVFSGAVGTLYTDLPGSSAWAPMSASPCSRLDERLHRWQLPPEQRRHAGRSMHCSAQADGL